MKVTTLLLVMFFGIATVFGQNAKKINFVKVSKDVRKEVKKIEKDGWKNIPGDLPVSQQLNSTFDKQMAEDESGYPKYIIGTGISKGATQAAAEMQALELAKLDLVSILESNINQAAATDLSNNQISNSEATSINRTMKVATNKVSKKLQYTKPILKLVRASKGLYEVRIQIAYNYEMVRKMVQQEILEDQTNDFRKEQAEFLNPEKHQTSPIKNSKEYAE